MTFLFVCAVGVMILIALFVAIALAIFRPRRGSHYPVQPAASWPGANTGGMTGDDEAARVASAIVTGALLDTSLQQSNTPAFESTPAAPSPSPSFEPTILENPDPPAASPDSGPCFDSGDTGAGSSNDSTA